MSSTTDEAVSVDELDFLVPWALNTQAGQVVRWVLARNGGAFTLREIASALSISVSSSSQAIAELRRDHGWKFSTTKIGRYVAPPAPVSLSNNGPATIKSPAMIINMPIMPKKRSGFCVNRVMNVTARMSSSRRR